MKYLKKFNEAAILNDEEIDELYKKIYESYHPLGLYITPTKSAVVGSTAENTYYLINLDLNNNPYSILSIMVSEKLDPKSMSILPMIDDSKWHYSNRIYITDVKGDKNINPKSIEEGFKLINKKIRDQFDGFIDNKLKMGHLNDRNYIRVFGYKSVVLDYIDHLTFNSEPIISTLILNKLKPYVEKFNSTNFREMMEEQPLIYKAISSLNLQGIKTASKLGEMGF